MRSRRDARIGLVLACSLAACAAWAGEALDAAGVRGGLVVHIGCGDGEQTAALAKHAGLVVHGLEPDAARVAKARAAGRYFVEHWPHPHLPYVDNLVNKVISQDLGTIPVSEVMRILAPGGAAVIGDKRTVKPRPEDIDEWTHYLHGPSNNAVARDARVGPPRHAQWVAGPKYARHHNHLASLSAMVSARGRVFAIIDEGPIASLQLPSKWALIARDAFNGIVLWKRPVGPWEGRLRPFRSGPTELARRLVAVDDHVYVTLGYGKPLVALDAATGKTVCTFPGTDGAVEVLCTGNLVYAVVGTLDESHYAESRSRGAAAPPPRSKRILVFAAHTGQLAWQKADDETADMLPTTLCVDGGRAFFQSPKHVVCLDAASGKPLWRAPRPVRTDRFAWSAPTLVVHDGVVLSADCTPTPAKSAQVKWTVTARPKRDPDGRGELIAFDAADGKELWRCPTAHGYTSPADVLVINGLVWTGAVSGRNTTDFTEGRDLHNGAVKRALDTARAFESAHHHRCYRNKATSRYIVLGRTGIELIGLNGGTPLRHCWVRGGCQYGVMPANGLIYTPPHSCACYIQSKLSGLWALGSARQRAAAQPPRLERGPAFGKLGEIEAATDSRRDWPMHRRDAARSGRSASQVPAKLAIAWQADVGGKLTQPVIANGIAVIASVDAHTIHTFDAATGKPLWRFIAGGRVDSSPTLYAGLALFGCADGYVHALRLMDGALVWRFRAAPEDRRIVSYDQVESVWPVTGSVLVHKGTLFCTAGRSAFLDGGMVLHRLNPITGARKGSTPLSDFDPKTGGQREDTIEDVELPGALPGILSCDGDNLYLRDRRMGLDGVTRPPTVPHIYCSAGLLDDTWWHRTYWLWGERAFGRAAGWRIASLHRPSGRILVTDEETVFGYGRREVTYGGTGKDKRHLFRADKKLTPIEKPIKNRNVAIGKHLKPAKVTYRWSRSIAPLVVRAMVLADDTLWVAGQAGLHAVSATDGKTQAELRLPSAPVFDGMSAAQGRLYIATVDGRLHCYGKAD